MIIDCLDDGNTANANIEKFNWTNEKPNLPFAQDALRANVTA